MPTNRIGNCDLGASHKSKRRTDNVFRTFGGGGVKTPGRYLFQKGTSNRFSTFTKIEHQEFEIYRYSDFSEVCECQTDKEPLDSDVKKTDRH